MATSGDDSMLNATLVSALPPPMMASLNENQNKQAAPSSYQDLIKNLDIKQMSSQQNMQMPASIQMQQQVHRHSQQMPQQMPQQPSPESAMDMLHAQSTTYPGTMPQSAPIGEFSPAPSMNVSQGPVVNSLLPDPLFFNPPPVEKKKRRQPPAVEVAPQASGNILGDKIPAMDLNKIKPAILVAAIVFALLSWGAPVIARQLTWTVDAITGKFTSSGLIVISLLTGGIYLGIAEIIRNFGNGV